MKGECNVK